MLQVSRMPSRTVDAPTASLADSEAVSVAVGVGTAVGVNVGLGTGEGVGDGAGVGVDMGSGVGVGIEVAGGEGVSAVGVRVGSARLVHPATTHAVANTMLSRRTRVLIQLSTESAG